MIDENINVAVIGAGFVGPVHVEALKRLGVNITGILGVDERESSQAAESLNLPKAYKWPIRDSVDAPGVFWWCFQVLIFDQLRFFSKIRPTP